MMPKKTAEKRPKAEKKVKAEKPAEKPKTLQAFLSNFHHVEPFIWQPSGIVGLDLAIGAGIPRGRTIEIFGAEGSGKSLMGWSILKSIQNAGGETMLLENEATAPQKFMRLVGMNMERLVYERPETVEEFRDTTVRYVTGVRKFTKAPIGIMLDSIAGASAEKEWTDEDAEDMGGERPRDQDMASKAMALSNFFKQHTVWMAENDVTLICINQLRDKPGVKFGRTSDSPGGRALKFFSSVRIELYKGKVFERGGAEAGCDCVMRVEKNKCAQPHRKTTLRINYNVGYDPHFGALDMLVQAGRVSVERPGVFKVGEETFAEKELPDVLIKHPELLEPWQ
jgi:recombination protein RecA